MHYIIMRAYSVFHPVISVHIGGQHASVKRCDNPEYVTVPSSGCCLILPAEERALQKTKFRTVAI